MYDLSGWWGVWISSIIPELCWQPAESAVVWSRLMCPEVVIIKQWLMSDERGHLLLMLILSPTSGWHSDQHSLLSHTIKGPWTVTVCDMQEQRQVVYTVQYMLSDSYLRERNRVHRISVGACSQSAFQKPVWNCFICQVSREPASGGQIQSSPPTHTPQHSAIMILNQ